MYEIIDKTRLDEYIEGVKELNRLLELKTNIIQKCGLQAVDISKDKITHGNGSKLTEEERYVAKLTKINKQIDDLRPRLAREHIILKTQIGRIKKHDYRKVLIYRYVEGWKWSDIIENFFEYESDYEEQKNDKYKDKILYWHRRALEELQKVSSKPFIKYEQISFL